jgi:hypothetical protein
MPLASLTAKIKDYSGEYTTTTFYVDGLDAIDTFDGANIIMQNLETALGGLILGTLVDVAWRQKGVDNVDALPASGEAQREKGLRFFFHDDVTGEKGNITIGTVDYGAIAQPETDLVDLANAEVAPVVTWVEANVQLNEGNSVTVDRAVLVGRNS